MKMCEVCNGQGFIRCPRCGGRRYVSDTGIYTYRDDERNEPCSVCGMRGWIPCHCLRPSRCPHWNCRGYDYPNCPCGTHAYRALPDTPIADIRAILKLLGLE